MSTSYISTEVLTERMTGIEREVAELKGVMREGIKELRECIQGNGNEGLKAKVFLNRAHIKWLWTLEVGVIIAIIGGLFKLLAS